MIATQLSNKQFKNFGEFRNAFWQAASKDPVLSKQFSRANLAEMKKGNAPFVSKTQQLGKRQRYELDHNHEIQNGGSVYDMNNIVIRTPLNHVKGK